MIFSRDDSKHLYFKNSLLTFAALLSIILFPHFSLAKDRLAGSTSVETLANLSIEELMSLEVSSTSFFDMPPEKAPGSLYLITQDKMENSYGSTISDFLEYYVPGVNISHAYSSGSLYSTRGFASSSNSTTLFMINGFNMNIMSGTGINTNLNLPLLGDVERIEVLKGPCSIVHGSGAINGFINVVQKNGGDNPGGFINTEIGLSDGLITSETGYGVSSSDVGDMFIYAGAVKSDGIGENTNSSDNASQSTINENYFPDINTRFSLNWNRKNFSLTTQVQNEKVESTLPERTYSAGEEVKNANKQMVMKSMALLPKMNFEFTDTETVTIGVPVQYFEYDPVYFSPQTSNLASELQLKSNLIFKTTRFLNHRMALGSSATLKRFNADTVSVDSPSLVTDNHERVDFKEDLEWVETSIFFEDNYQLTNSLKLFAGIRYDAIPSSSLKFINLESFTFINKNGESEEVAAGKSIEEKFGTLDILIPRVGITYDIDDDKLVKFIYQEGYHNPDYITTMKYLSFNEPLVAEEVQSYELGYTQEFMRDRLRLNLNIYNNIFHNTAFRLVKNEINTATNNITTDQFSASGFETALLFDTESSSSIELSYSFSKPHNMSDNTEINPTLFDESGEHWKGYPEQTIKLNINKMFMEEKLNLSLGCLFSKSIDTVDEGLTQEQNSETDLFNHDRFVVNGSVRYHLTKNCSIILKGENIFNNRVPAAGYYYNLLNAEDISLEHPTYTIGLSWKF